MTELRVYTVIVHDTEEDEIGYWAEVEELPGCFASADTLQELDGDVRQAIEAYLFALGANGQPAPKVKHADDGSMRRWELAVPV